MQNKWYKLALLSLLCSAMLGPQPVQANTAQRQDVKAFIEQLASEHDFDRGELEQLFSKIEIQPEIIDAMNRPYEGKPDRKSVV